MQRMNLATPGDGGWRQQVHIKQVVSHGAQTEGRNTDISSANSVYPGTWVQGALQQTDKL